MTRSERLEAICSLVGDPVRVIDVGDGWPGLIEVMLTSGEVVRVALHVSLVGSHSRRSYELRFQNPGNSKPVSAVGGALPILLGYAEQNGKPLLVATNGNSRLGRVKRFSILFRDTLLMEARHSGWAVYENSNSGYVYAFAPALLPVFVEMMLQGLSDDLQASGNDEIRIAVESAGVAESSDTGISERARRTASMLVRNYAFGREVVSAYNSLCAMCGLDSGLVVGAHILPVAAPNSPDKLWNGLALCHNHHVAFDAHKIWVHPVHRSVNFRPDMHAQAEKHSAARAFVNSTFLTLAAPSNKAALPRDEMFQQRYEFFDKSQYKWVKHLQ